jgi:hypothetical protein
MKVNRPAYLSVGLQRGAVAHALVDGDAHGESHALQHDLAGLALALVHGVGSLLNQLVTELADVSNLGTGNALY